MQSVQYAHAFLCAYQLPLLFCELTPDRTLTNIINHGNDSRNSSANKEYSKLSMVVTAARLTRLLLFLFVRIVRKLMLGIMDN